VTGMMPPEPQPDGPTVRVRMRAIPASIHEARHLVDKLCAQVGVEGSARADVALAVSEAMTNAVCHGYRNDQTGDIDVLATVEGDELVVIIRDYGVGPILHPEAPGLGMGIQVMSELATECHVVPAEPGTAATLRFKTTATHSPRD
jgi:stage II sporulation protein AB (anti-sigma F factor)